MLMKAKFCDQCGEQLVENSKFCIYCGAKLPEPYNAEAPETVTEPDNIKSQIGPGYVKVEGSPFKKVEPTATPVSESEVENKPEAVSGSYDQAQVGPKFVKVAGSPFNKAEPVFSDEPEPEPEIEEPDTEPEPEPADKLEIPKFATDPIADPIFDPEPEREFTRRDPEQTLDRINIPEFSDDGEETVYLGVNSGRDEPESIEQKFSRLAPIAELVKERSGEKIVIDRPEFVLGKNPNHTDFAVRDNNTVSRIHASITWNEEGYRISDLGSMNGTYVNKETVDVDGQLLHDGDVIELSDEAFILSIRDIR